MANCKTTNKIGPQGLTQNRCQMDLCCAWLPRASLSVTPLLKCLGPRGQEWGDTWTCPCAPQGLAKASCPPQAGRPKGKIQNVHLGGGGGAEIKMQMANCQSTKQKGPTGPTQKGCHMDPCCATAKRACVLSIFLTMLLIVCGPCPQFWVTHGHRHVPRRDELCRLPCGPPASNSMSPYPTNLNAASGSAMAFTSH